MNSLGSLIRISTDPRRLRKELVDLIEARQIRDYLTTLLCLDEPEVPVSEIRPSLRTG